MQDAAADPRFARRSAPRQRLLFSWSDPRFRNLVWQGLVVAAIGAVLWYLIGNTTRNLEARRIATGFAFLDRTAGIPIGEQVLPYDPSVNTYFYALVEGVLNTLKVALIGIVLATVWGTTVGLARLSSNYLLARLSAIYVETLRDIPLLLQLLFWYALLQNLPPPREAIAVGAVFLSNRGIKLPILTWSPAYAWILAALILGIAMAVAWARRARARRDATGAQLPILVPTVALILGLPLLVWLAAGLPFSVDAPVLRGFNFQGGLTLSPEYAALLLGLVIYTASYIAEIVRAGVLSVAKGQWEAAGALGLRRAATLRRVVLPQALRVIIPPITSQYLNLTKNSSLAVAIGYQDIVSIANTILNQTGQAIEGIALIMAVYLTISLSISGMMNWYNARVALRER